MCNVAHVHQLLRWANKREVARELTRRGFDVSGETLNRWVREEREFPPVVERMVRDMYGLTTKEAAPPAMEERLARVESLLVEIARATPGVRPELLEIHERVLELERARQQRGEQRQPADPDAQGTPPGTLL